MWEKSELVQGNLFEEKMLNQELVIELEELICTGHGAF